MEFDYLVIGAGLAGCACGRLLALSGARVLAVDKADLVAKDKLCGGLLTPRSVKLMEKLYGPSAQTLYKQTHTSLTALAFGHVQTLDDVDVRGVDRQNLDRFVLENYLDAGGLLLDKTRVSQLDLDAGIAVLDVEGQEVVVSFKVCIAADGASSHARRTVCGSGLAPETLPSVEAFVQPSGQGLTGKVLMKEAGYCWYIPCGDTANIGCDARPGTSGKELQGYLEEFAQEVSVDLSGARLRGAPIPSGGTVLLQYKKFNTPVFFVGDSAGLAAPATGEGIYYALRSAYQLACALIMPQGPGYTQRMALDVATLKRQYACLGLVFNQTAMERSLKAAHATGIGGGGAAKFALKFFAGF